MMRKKRAAAAVFCLAAFMLQGCAGTAQGAEPVPKPTGVQVKAQVSWPNDKLETDENGTPLLKVYVTETDKIETVDVETYVEGVLAGEMKNDWPMEALKAQAILARTFVLKFVDEKESKYPDADISTDIEEAQAYAPDQINDRIRQAVEETRGLVLSAEGELPYAWFHAHSGGRTERAVTGLGWDQAEPRYTAVVEGMEPVRVEEESQNKSLKDATAWQASFPLAEFQEACRKQDESITVEEDTRLAVGERGEGGRADTLKVGQWSVNAAQLRIDLGSTKMRSTLLTSLKQENGQVIMAGKGYGHGVGMSQWGAYGMAEQGKTAEEIVRYYFTDVAVEKIW